METLRKLKFENIDEIKREQIIFTLLFDLCAKVELIATHLPLLAKIENYESQEQNEANYKAELKRLEDQIIDNKYRLGIYISDEFGTAKNNEENISVIKQ